MAPGLNFNCFNARSLVNKIDYFKALLNSFLFDIICVTETWLYDQIPSSLVCENSLYSIFRSDRTNSVKTRGGGVAIILSSAIDCVQIKVDKIPNIDILCLDIFNTTHEKQIRIINVYAPPGLTLSDVNNLIDVLGNLISVSYPKIILGDFNMSHIYPFQPNLHLPAHEKLFAEFISEAELTQLVNSPTRGDKIIDFVLTDKKSLLSNIKVLPPFTSSCDHNQISFSFAFDRKSREKEKVRSYGKCDLSAMLSFLANIDWEKQIFASCADIDSLYSKFQQCCSHAIEKFVPFVEIKRDRLPPHIHKLKIYREKLWRNIKYSSVKHKYAKTTAILEKEILKYHKNKERRLLSKKSAKQIYSYVSKQIKSKNTQLPTIIYQNSTFSNKKDVADIFAKYFSSVFLKPTNFKTNISNVPMPNRLNFLDICPIMVYKHLKNLPRRQNTSPDGIPYIFLKLCAEPLTYPITRILQFSMMTGTIPSIWKKAFVLPLHKKGDTNNVENYRPISLTCSLSKLAEKLICDVLVSYCDKYSIIPSFQHGFRSKKSVTSQMIETLNDWTLAIEKGMFVDVIYFDIAKAFDTVSHEKLIAKLQNFGIDGTLLLWIKNFLIDRELSVKIGNKFSGSEKVTSGVPQGSVIGPLLFIIYISDIAKILLNDQIKLKLFADDLKMYLIYTDPSQSIVLQNCINNFLNWCAENELNIAPHKCSVLHLGRNNPQSSYAIQENIISSVTNSVRDLGILIQPDLKWKSHIDECCRKASIRLYTLFKALKSNNAEFYTQMYKAYVRPILETSSPLFNPYFKKDILKLESIQRKAVNLIHFKCLRNKMPNMSYSELLKTLKLETLQMRRLKNDLIFLHKIFIGDIKIDPEIVPKFSYSNTRSRGFKIDFCKTNARYHFFFNRTVPIYNSLPIAVRASSTSCLFKNKLNSLNLESKL